MLQQPPAAAASSSQPAAAAARTRTVLALGRMAYCSEHPPRRHLLRSEFAVPAPGSFPLGDAAAPLLCPLGLSSAGADAATVSLFFDAEQPFPTPFRTAGTAEAVGTTDARTSAGADPRNIVLDLRHCGAFATDDARADSASESVRAMWVWPPAFTTAAFLLDWFREQATRPRGACATGGDGCDVGGVSSAKDPTVLDILELGAGTGASGLCVALALDRFQRRRGAATSHRNNRRQWGRVYLSDGNPAALRLVAQ